MTPEEQRMDYQTTIQDIRDFKANQWRFSHYGLLAQAAIVAVGTQLEAHPWLLTAKTIPTILTGLSLVAVCASLFLVNEAQKKIMQSRCRHKALMIPRSEDWLEFSNTFGATRENNKAAKPWENDQQFKWLFCGVQITGAFLAILVIWSQVSACLL